MSTFFDLPFRLIPERRFHSPLDGRPDKVLTGYSVGRGCVKTLPRGVSEEPEAAESKGVGWFFDC